MAVDHALSDYDDTVPISSILANEPLRYVGDARRISSVGFTYQFAVYDGTTVSDQVALFPNPQSINLTEPSATMVQSLQGRGKYIERRGNINKQLVIAGTTGYIPNVRAAALNDFQQRFRIQGDDKAAANLASISGYAKFHEIRNFFRKYQNAFASNKRETNQNMRMVWLNYKDDEFFIVEPGTFVTTRDRSSPLGYSYQITCNFIGVADADLFRDRVGEQLAKSRLLKAVQAMAAIATTISNAVNVLSAVINQVSETVKAVIQAAVSLASNILTAINNVTAAFASFLEIPQTVVKTAASTFKQVLDVANQVGQLFTTDIVEACTDTIIACQTLAAQPGLFVKTFDEEWKSAVVDFGATTTSGDAIDLTSQLQLTGVTEDEVKPGETIQMVASRILGDPSRFMELVILNGLQAPYISPNQNERYPNTLAKGDTILVPETRGRERSPNPISISGSRARSNPTLVSVAVGGTPSSLTADPTVIPYEWRTDQWKGFLCKFVSGTGAGEQVLIASNTANTLTFNKAVTSPDATTIFQIVSATSFDVPSGAVESLGVDIALTEDYDFGKDASGDLAVVKYLDNMDQAIGIMTRTEQGTLIAHQFFGLLPPIGEPMTPVTISQHRLNARRTLLADTRIAKVTRFSVQGQGDEVTTDGEVELKFNGSTRPFKGESA